MKKIILVVDSAIIALEIKRDLENRGYQVPLITSALKEVFREDYDLDLIILDLDFISTEQIGLVRVPIIFLSSLDESDITSDLSGLQVTYDFLYKPFTQDELLGRTNQILTTNH